MVKFVQVDAEDHHGRPGQLISALADYGDMPADSEALLLSKFEKVFNRLFQSDLKEALEKVAAYTAKPSLQGLLTATQLVMNSW